MQRFTFHLDRVLGWYDEQREAEERRLSSSLAALTSVQEAIARLEAERSAIAREMISRQTILARDLAALGLYRLGAKTCEMELNARREHQEVLVNEQRLKVLAAQRRVKLLEKLRARQKAEHDYQQEKDLEKMVADAYLSGWSSR